MLPIIKEIRKSHTGEKFGKLTVAEYCHHIGKSAYWNCTCDCGNSKIIRYNCLNEASCCGICNKTTGSQHYAWQGCGDLPKDVYTTYKHGAIARKLEFEVSIEYLWELFQKQEGKCALTGWDIYFNKTHRTKTTKTASPDRIDSTKGYIEGNIQWVHRDVNKLKKNLPNDRFISLCQAIASFTKEKL